jgi:type IV pilus assembly protein PilA
MSTIKCPQCNLVNWTTQAACKRCGLELAYSQPAIPPVTSENFSGQQQQQQQYGATNASYNAPQAGFQPSTNPFASPTEFNHSSQYSSQNNYRQNYQQPNYQPNYNQNYQPNYQPNNLYQNAGLKIKLAVVSLVFGILGLPPIIFFAMGLLAGLLGAIFGVGGAVIGVLIPLAWIPTALICGIVALRRTSKAPHEYGGKGMAIAGIVLSGLTILLVPIVAAIAIPNLLAARRSANEGAALSSIRTLSGAEATYQATTGAGSCGDLQALADAGLIDKTLATGEKSGYRFTVTVQPPTFTTPANCEVFAKPLVTQGVSSTGNRTFYASMEEGWSIHWARSGDNPADENSPLLEDNSQSRSPKSDPFKNY